MRYIFTHTRTALIKKTENSSYWQRCGKSGTLVHGGGNIKWCSLCGKQFGSPQKIKHSFTTWPSNSILRYIPKRNEDTSSHKDLYTNVHSSIIHNRQKMETTQMSINWWMVKKLWYIQMIAIKGMKYWYINNDTGEFQNNYAKWKKSDAKDYIAFIYIKCPKKVNLERQKVGMRNDCKWICGENWIMLMVAQL